VGQAQERFTRLFGAPRSDEAKAALSGVRARHPSFRRAVAADVRVTCSYRGERYEATSRWHTYAQALRLAVVSDSFFAQLCYRAKASCQARGIRVLPHLLHRLAIVTGQICIGEPVVVQPGVYIAHGQVVIDGFVEIGRGVILFPFVTIGLRAGVLQGPTIGDGTSVGTGSKVIGPVRVGRQARIGANAVVTDDVADHTTVVGAPARPVS
jgi:serine acetyltransferase